MLEEEGVVFDCDGKINIDCFVDISSVMPSATSVSSTTAQGGKKRKANDNTSTKKKKTKSKYFTDTTTTQSTTATTISEATLKQEILTLLQKRQVGKTC